MFIFLGIKTLVVFELIHFSSKIKWVEFFCISFFVPFFLILMREYYNKNKESVKLNQYSKLLNETLIRLTHHNLFYDGKLVEGGKLLTKEVTKTLSVDRCSIWLYNDKNTSIICSQLYDITTNTWSNGFELYEKDYKPYFDDLRKNGIISANDVTTHPATICFNETYTNPLGIKSILDVPIIYKGTMIGVICIESLKLREWNKIEINFTEMLSSLFSFTYSVKETNDIKNELSEFENFVNKSVLVSKTDKRGRITYVNDKFQEVSGYSFEETIGKDHNIINSGVHTSKFWKNMYKTVKNGEIWNDLVTNKRKNGELYWVDTYIKGVFKNNRLIGYLSIRQDVTDLYKNINEISKKNTYLEHASKILRHDMHSGINTYIPRGLSSLERRLSPEDIERLKLEIPIRLLKEGLKHTQKVYKGVYEFTNLVKHDSDLSKEKFNLKEILTSFLSSTAYSSQVSIGTLPTIEVNESLFCTAIDNLIRNGLRYNDSESKIVKIYMDDDNHLTIQDNGRGMTQEEFEIYSKPYNRKPNQKESGTGLGLNICIAILNEHGFTITCEKNEIGTKLKIKIK